MKKITLYGIAILLVLYFTGAAQYSGTVERTLPILKDTTGKNKTDIHKDSDSLVLPKEINHFYFLMYS